MNLFWRTIKAFSKKEKIIASVLLIVFLGSVYSVLLGSPSGSGIGNAKAYSEGVVGEIQHLNPVFTEFSEADTEVCSLIFSGLVKYNSATQKFEEDLATHTLSKDQLTYTFTLKNDLYWQDGTEITGDDLYFTFAEVIQSPEFANPILKSNFDGVEIELVDSRTISFTLNSKNSFFFTGMTVGILPHHILGEVPVSELDTHEFNKLPVGSGPYMAADSYEILPDGATSVSLTVNPLYYGEIPSMENIRFMAYPSVTQLVDNRSSWHGAARIRQSQLDEIKDLDELVSYQYELPQYTALFFNTDSAILGAQKARLGVSKVINKAEILEAIGYKVQIDTPLLELNQDEWLHTHDLEEAGGALFDAGWSLAEDAIYRTDSEGETMSLRLIRRDFSGVNELQEEIISMAAHLIQEQLQEAGIAVEIEVYSITELQDIITNRDFDMLLYGQSLGYNLDTFAYWHSSQATESGLNLSNYQNAKADFYLENIRGTFDDDEKQENLESLAEIIAADVPAVFLYTPSYYYLQDVKVTGFSFEKLLHPRDRFANIAAWIFN
jgi:peptide/nickel transport system substrate-binding protein